VIATVTPPHSTPAPAITPTQVEATVTVVMNGTPLGTTTTEVQLMLGTQVIADQPIDISQFQQGENIMTVDFKPPTDPDLLGVLPLSVTVNASKSVKESNYGNNTFNTTIDLMVLCQVANAGRVVPFYAQSSAPWGPEPYGIPSISSGTFNKYGCSITDIDMLFSSYGITHVPQGSPASPFGVTPPLPGLSGESLNPGTLNSAMANYKTNFISVGSVGFDANNDPIWPGAAQVARAGYQAQCVLSKTCDPANAPNIVSFKGAYYGGYTPEEAIDAIQNEVCSGNPVMMKFSKAGGGQHFMLATGIVFDSKNHQQTLQVNNPGDSKLGANALYTNLVSKYPSIIGYTLFHPSADPSMMFIAAPMGVHFVVTDPLGRRAGFNPITGTSYSEIPNASYAEQSINTPGDAGYTPSTLVDERYFISSSDVPAGSYQVQVFSVTGGSYYLDYRSYDSAGTTNDAHFQTGTLKKGATSTVTFQHSVASVPVPNATLSLNGYLIEKSYKENLKDATIGISGRLVAFSKTPLSLKSSFQFAIGGISGYQLTVPASEFKSITFHKETFYYYENRDIRVWLDRSGQFEVEIRNANLSSVDPSLLGYVSLSVDSVFGDVSSKLNCHYDFCSTNDYYHRHDHNEHHEDWGWEHR